MPNVDLHCHSTASDGVLTPAEVVARAATNGVDALALTDHDDVSGIAEARAAADAAEIQLITGVEISASWGGQSVHVVGLRIDPDHPRLHAGLSGIRLGRIERARRMGARLATAGISGAYDGARRGAGSGELVGRTHFARWLVAEGHAPDVQSAFRRFLTPGTPGYVEHEWCSLEDAVGWIRESGGSAVIAHPGSYAFSPGKLRQLLETFCALGGAGLEVVSGSQHSSAFGRFADLARGFGLLASRGSDFHAPGEGVDLGGMPPLPRYAHPIWQSWPLVGGAKAAAPRDKC